MNKKKVLCIGWEPNSVDYSKYPGMDPERLRSVLEVDLQKLNDIGYDAQMGYITSEESAVKEVVDLLSNRRFDIVLIGAGVRKDDDCFYLFEKLVNVVHQYATTAKICFNTGPTDSVQAVQRWDL
ncbi:MULTISPECIES: hypothetical protein [Francisella]|uniref:Uncharacterized protein n=1 Tax=Francisella marina TaxID=2249302 RepID=A0ABX5ZF36_9GAMM|nr:MULTISPECIES: hypothetical protein [Francisella]QEO56815.1 hypothetical protein F0R74_02750 [Francisella marina]QEO59066.1 hypothetical protein F0R75_04475 [Francisella marina]